MAPLRRKEDLETSGGMPLPLENKANQNTLKYWTHAGAFFTVRVLVGIVSGAPQFAPRLASTFLMKCFFGPFIFGVDHQILPPPQYRDLGGLGGAGNEAM